MPFMIKGDTQYNADLVTKHSNKFKHNIYTLNGPLSLLRGKNKKCCDGNKNQTDFTVCNIL